MNLRERLLTGLTLAFIFLLILAWDIDAAHWITSGGAYPGVFGIRGALAKVSPVLAALPCTSATILLTALVGAVVSLALACILLAALVGAVVSLALACWWVKRTLSRH